MKIIIHLRKWDYLRLNQCQSLTGRMREKFNIVYFTKKWNIWSNVFETWKSTYIFQEIRHISSDPLRKKNLASISPISTQSMLYRKRTNLVENTILLKSRWRQGYLPNLKGEYVVFFQDLVISAVFATHKLSNGSYNVKT